MASFFESVFEFLFKYRPSVFEQGKLAMGAPRSLVLSVLLITGLMALLLVWRYRLVGRDSRPRDRRILVLLRLSVLATLAFCLLQPTLVLSVVVPQQSFVGVVMDDSRSMRIADEDGSLRGSFLHRALDAETGSLYQALADRFKVRLFGFGRQFRRLDDVTELRFSGSETHLGQAMQGAAEELQAVPLSGLVVLSDGADNSNTPLEDALLDMRARSVPVFTVGLGQERFEKDVEVSRVIAPPTVLKGSSLVVEVTLSQSGFSGTQMLLEVLDSGRILSTQDVRFPTNGESVTVQVHLTASEAGPRLFNFRIAPRAGESVTENNEQPALIQVQDRVEKILYFEGEPRWEVKYMRRALDDDDNLQLVVLQRTAENKFLRLAIDSEDELQGGFPTTPEELFAYRGLILGSVEASFFTYEQMRMIVDFVSQRGGGFMMLGGRSAFAAGGYAETPIDELLPVVLGASGGGGEGIGDEFFSEIQVALTRYGRTHPALRLGGDEEESAKRWEDLPPLSTFHRLYRLKPGATSLLVGNGDAVAEDQIVLAHQRYGRGRALAFTVHDSWVWQMDNTINVEDTTHETLWRQLLRWLVSYVPEPVVITPQADRVAPGELVNLLAEVRDETYLAVNSAKVMANVRTPTGESLYLPMEWTVEKDGEYRASFTAREEGRYRVEVDGRSGDRVLGTATTYVESTPLATEYFQAEMRPSLLRRIAEETGGRYYTPDTVSHLAEDLSYAEGGSTILEHKDLWDMPFLFLLLVCLLAAEWTFRKARGLV